MEIKEQLYEGKAKKVFATDEISELNKRLPITDQQTLITDFPFIFDDKHLDAVNSYIAYYKYYPNYHLVSF